MVRRLLVAGVVSAAAAGVTVLPAGPASAAPPKCDGKTATIVSKGPVIKGTAGNDVIVARGSAGQKVDAGGGNDVVCLGAGNDRADGGAGNDRILGGVGDDYLEDVEGSNRLLGGDGGDFLVGRASNGALADLRGGAGKDNVNAGLRPGGTLALDGGENRDHLDLELAGGPAGQAVTLDRGAGTLTVGEAQVATVTGLEVHYLYGDLDWTYVGIDGVDSVGAMQGDFDIRLGGGDDQVVSLTGATDHTDGGAGNDTGYYGSGTHTCVSVETLAQGTCSPPVVD